MHVWQKQRLLAMEGRFEDYTVGREITMDRVKEIYQLFKKHQFKIAGLRSFGKYVDDDLVAAKREYAEQYRKNPELFAQVQEETGRKIASMPVMSKGVKESNQSPAVVWVGITAVLGLIAFLLGRRRGKKL